MKTFKISRNSNEVVNTVPLKYDPDELFLSGESVCIIANREDTYDLNVGGSLHLVKNAEGNDGKTVKVCETDVKILNIVDFTEDDVKKREIYVEYTYIEPLTLSALQNISGGTFKYKMYFTSDALFAPGDFEKYKTKNGIEYRLYVKNGTGNMIYFNGLALCYPYELVSGASFYQAETECTDEVIRNFNYETMEKNSVLARNKTGNTFEPSFGDLVYPATNPYYFTKSGKTEDKIILFDNVLFEKYTNYMNLDLVFEQDYDAKRMFQEYQVNELFVKKIKNSIIPDFIDLEKVKFAPAYITEITDETDTATTEEVASLATGLTFNLHFRSRIPSGEEIPDVYSFEDTWHFDDTSTEVTWNGNGYDEDTGFDVVEQDNLYENEEFVNSSNLIGYLGFTDDDIYNQKNRVKQSFLRLLFYDDDNPLTQNLLFYSTIFMDSGELYGRFIKKKARLFDEYDNYDEESYPVVWSPYETDSNVSAVTSQMTVNDE